MALRSGQAHRPGAQEPRCSPSPPPAACLGRLWGGAHTQRFTEHEPRSRKNYLERERDFVKRIATQEKQRQQEALSQHMASYTLPVYVFPVDR